MAQVLPRPVSAEKQVPSYFRSRHIPRRFRGLLLGLFFLAVFAFLIHSHYFLSDPVDPVDPVYFLHGLPKPEPGPNPPRFFEWYEREKRLPQHNPDLPYPQGRDGSYIRFANQGNSVGWGNIMQEVILNAHLAYLSKRTYVFENYTWDMTPGDFSNFQGKPIPARVPLTSLLSGPTAGDPFPSSADTPPAVIPEFFYTVCPTPTIIHRDEVNGLLPGASASSLFHAWIDKLEHIEDRCVEIQRGTWQVFDLWLFGDSSRLLDLWPSLSTSPIMTHFSWSPLIIAALVANADVIHPALSSATSSSFMPHSNPAPLAGLLALHVRRGDYIDHCVHLTTWSAVYMGFNGFPGLPDKFPPPPPYGPDNVPPEEVVRYNRHCFPDINQIVTRVREVRVSLLPTTSLTRVYVMTNGKPDWLRELKDALQEDARREGLDEWDHIGTSRDLRLTREQRHNSQALDMAVAQRAEVFIGNGFSTMTSNSVMLRAAHEYPWNKTRFW
ncbi:hypothetical protein F5148DRAFT_1233692 [Russula earlei]|uniref:Uncharacterized protein n=1 Tax=Russula earlei TaxID=71964 RepID=A0ACC0TXZ7_9AGAM|nr:hypothetical protein F5148DRAFT_1233692 [Russula earlei]